jgi:ubiquinone/menaquinone biosynthesis C-methylase UbiE
LLTDVALPETKRRYWRVAPLYDLLDWPFEPLYRPGRALIGQLASERTVELGAGTGKTFPYYRPAARVFALDASWAMLARARGRLQLPIRALVMGDVAHLPLRDACVDSVTATFVCCVQADPRPALREIARVLRPGGRAVFLEFVLPKHGVLRRLIRLLEPALRALYGVHWEHHLPGLLYEAGLNVIDVRPVSTPMIESIVAGKPPILR